MKKLFTLFVALLCMGNADVLAKWPTPKAPSYPGVQNFTELLKQVGQSSFRTAQLGFPDSAVISSWDNGAWSLDGNVGIRYQNGKVARLIFYAGSIPIINYVFTYDGAGRATLIEVQIAFPGQPVQVESRFIMNYDANGNQTSMQIYEQDNGSLVLNSGDSLQFVYNGSTVSEAIQMTYDDMASVPSWVNTQKFSSLTFGSNGQLTSLVATEWNPTTNSWSTADEYRYSNIQWNLGYPGLSALLGGLMDISQFLFTELPFAENEYNLSPTDYLEEQKSGGVFVNQYKTISTVNGGVVTQVLEQEWSNAAWVDNYRVAFTYSGTNMTQALNESNATGSWTASYRESWTYDASSNLTEEKQEFYNNGAWTTSYAKKHILDYTSDNRVYRWVSQDWDQVAMQYVNNEKREYYFGNFGLSTADLGTLTLKVYPNPVQNDLWIDASPVENALLQVYAVNGQMVMQQQFVTEQTAHPVRLDVSTLPQGMYRVVLSSSKGRLSQSVLKF